MLSKKINRLKFKYGVLRVKYSRMRVVKYNLKILFKCIDYLQKICIPLSEEENEVMKMLISTYDKNILELNKCVEPYRNRIKSDNA